MFHFIVLWGYLGGTNVTIALRFFSVLVAMLPECRTQRLCNIPTAHVFFKNAKFQTTVCSRNPAPCIEMFVGDFETGERTGSVFARFSGRLLGQVVGVP